MTPSGSEHTTSCRQVKHLVNPGSQKKSTVAEVPRSDLSPIPQIVVAWGDDRRCAVEFWPRPDEVSSADSPWRCDDIDVVDAAAKVGTHDAVDIVPETAFGAVLFYNADPVSSGDQKAEEFGAAAVGYAG
jgi:hypothetical protein